VGTDSLFCQQAFDVSALTSPATRCKLIHSSLSNYGFLLAQLCRTGTHVQGNREEADARFHAHVLQSSRAVLQLMLQRLYEQSPFLERGAMCDELYRQVFETFGASGCKVCRAKRRGNVRFGQVKCCGLYSSPASLMLCLQYPRLLYGIFIIRSPFMLRTSIEPRFGSELYRLSMHLANLRIFRRSKKKKKKTGRAQA